MKKAKVLILRTAGTNCDMETKAAFELAGADATLVHINELISKKRSLADFDILAVPGGFSYGDDIASGRILANELKYKLGDMIRRFDEAKKPIIGICNGFQVLVKMGILPGAKGYKQTVTLTFNDSDRFECRWIYLNPNSHNDSFWLEGLPKIIQLPIAHGEGKFVVKDGWVKNDNLIAVRYCDPSGNMADYPYNPNGSFDHIAGITNKAGNVFGLMPHPERFITKLQNPSSSPGMTDENGNGWGLKIFKNAVEYVG